MKKAVVLFSGGQDSTVCLFQAMQDCDQVYPLSIKYGQRHQERENQATLNIYNYITENDLHTAYGTQIMFPYYLYTTLLSSVSESALLDDVSDVNATREEADLPASFVPGRNILFLTKLSDYIVHFLKNFRFHRYPFKQLVHKTHLHYPIRKSGYLGNYITTKLFTLVLCHIDLSMNFH